MKQRAFSLLELMVVLGIAGLLFLFLGDLVKNTFNAVFSAQKRGDRDSSLALFQSIVDKATGGSTYSWKVFSGEANPDDKYVRAIFPLPGLCGDLSAQAECSGSISLMIGHLSALPGSSGRAYCWVDRSKGQLLVDTSFAQRGRSGDFRTFAVMAPPEALIWTSIEAPADVSITDKATGAPLPAECVSYMPKNPAGEYAEGDFKILTVRPFLPTYVTGTPPNLAVVPDEITRFPQQLLRAEFSSIGLRTEPDPKDPKKNRTLLAITQCVLKNERDFDCSAAPLHRVEEVLSTRAEAIFSIRFDGLPNTERFELLNGSQVVSPFCQMAECAPLRVMNSNLSAARRVTAAENFEHLNGSSFSFIKQEILTELRLFLSMLDKSEKTLIFRY